MISMSRTTWQDMLNSKTVYNDAIEAITKNPNVAHLLEYQKLTKYEASQKTQQYQNTYDYIFGKLPATKVVSAVLLKIRDRKVVFFDSPANTITLNDLVKYICGVLSRFIMIDKLVRRNLFIWNTNNNEKTFSLTFSEHYPDPNPASDIDDVINLRYKVINNKDLKIFAGFYDIQITTEDAFNFDDHERLPFTDFIKNCLERFELLVASKYYDVNANSRIVSKRYIELKSLVAEVKETLKFDSKNLV